MKRGLAIKVRVDGLLADEASQPTPQTVKTRKELEELLTRELLNLDAIDVSNDDHIR